MFWSEYKKMDREAQAEHITSEYARWHEEGFWSSAEWKHLRAKVRLYAHRNGLPMKALEVSFNAQGRERHLMGR